MSEPPPESTTDGTRRPYKLDGTRHVERYRIGEERTIATHQRHDSSGQPEDNCFESPNAGASSSDSASSRGTGVRIAQSKSAAHSVRRAALRDLGHPDRRVGVEYSLLGRTWPPNGSGHCIRRGRPLSGTRCDGRSRSISHRSVAEVLAGSPDALSGALARRAATFRGFDRNRRNSAREPERTHHPLDVREDHRCIDFGRVRSGVDYFHSPLVRADHAEASGGDEPRPISRSPPPVLFPGRETRAGRSAYHDGRMDSLPPRVLGSLGLRKAKTSCRR